MSEERAFRRSKRDVRKVGLQEAIRATRRASTSAVVRQRRNRGLTLSQAFTSKTGPSILGALVKTAKGEAPFPIPFFGGTGRAMQIRAIGRQQLARVPLPAKIVGGAVGITAATEAITGQSPIPFVRGQLLKQTLGRGSAPRSVARRQQVPRGQLVVGGQLPPSHQVVRTWQTFPGGPIFARLADGHIAVQKKDGTIKHFRPYRPVVIPRKWNARSMSRVATALKRQRKTATKILRITGGLPTKTVRVGGKSHRSVDV